MFPNNATMQMTVNRPASMPFSTAVTGANVALLEFVKFVRFESIVLPMTPRAVREFSELTGQHAMCQLVPRILDVSLISVSY